MHKKSRNQVRDNGRRKGGISEVAAVGAAMAGGAIGATVAAVITTGQLKKRVVKAANELRRGSSKKQKSK